MMLVILIAITTFTAYGSFGEIILSLPFYPLGALMYGEKYVFIALSLLPSLVMLAGMMIKQKECLLPLWKQLKMPKNAVIMNNLIAIVVFAFSLFIPIIFIGILVLLPPISDTFFLLILGLIAGLCITTVFLLYFLAGQFLLSKTPNTLTNIFSVLSVVILLIIMIVFYLRIEGNYYLLLFLLPLIMLAGLVTQKQKRRLLWKERAERRLSFLKKIKISKNGLIANNVIAIIIHICVCFAFVVPLFVLKIGLFVENEIILCLFIGFYIITAVFLYYSAGRFLLHIMPNTQKNVFSVIVLAIILIATAIAYVLAGTKDLPFYFPGGLIFDFIFYIPYMGAENKFVFIALSPLPALIMLAGMMMKQKQFRLPWYKEVKE